MREEALIQYFAGAASLTALLNDWQAGDLVYPFRDMYTCFPIDSACLLPLAAAAAAGEAEPAFLREVAEVLLTSEKFDWADDVAPEVCHFWAYRLSGPDQIEQSRRRLAGETDEPLPD